MKIKEIFQKNRKNGLIFVKNRDFWKSRRNPFRRSFSAETFSAEISGDQCTLISRPTTLIWPECVHLRPRVQKTHEAIHQNERATKQFNAEKITRLDIRKSLNLSDIIIDVGRQWVQYIIILLRQSDVTYFISSLFEHRYVMWIKS